MTVNTTSTNEQVNEEKEMHVSTTVTFVFERHNDVARLVANVTKDVDGAAVSVSKRFEAKSHNTCFGRGFEGWNNEPQSDQKGMPVPCSCLIRKVGKYLGIKSFKYKIEVK